MTLPNQTERRAIVDTHWHPWTQARSEDGEAGLYDRTSIPADQRQRLNLLSRVCRLDHAMPKQREGGVTLSLASNGGEVEWFARDLPRASTRPT
jgi:hypothetical protein